MQWRRRKNDRIRPRARGRKVRGYKREVRGQAAEFRGQKTNCTLSNAMNGLCDLNSYRIILRLDLPPFTLSILFCLSFFIGRCAPQLPISDTKRPEKGSSLQGRP